MPAAPLPLFLWQEVADLEQERAQLRARLRRLPLMSHRRVELTARLKQLTDEELRLLLQRRRTE